jgi:uncharacterized glyoxalase superfamily protein PhnB
MKNRSVPADSILPHVVYQDVGRAIDWLTKVFGFSEHYRYGDPSGPAGAQMRAGSGWIMLTSPRPGRSSPSIGAWTQSLTVFVDDVDAHYQRSKSAAARIVEEVNETMYGEYQYGVTDLEGHHWLFSRHARDVDPAEWGATVNAAVERP